MRNFAKLFKSRLQSESTRTLLLVQLAIKYNEQEVLNMLRVESFWQVIRAKPVEYPGDLAWNSWPQRNCKPRRLREIGPFFPRTNFREAKKRKILQTWVKPMETLATQSRAPTKNTGVTLGFPGTNKRKIALFMSNGIFWLLLFLVNFLFEDKKRH